MSYMLDPRLKSNMGDFENFRFQIQRYQGYNIIHERPYPY